MNNANKQRKTKNVKDKRSLQENWRYQGNISCKDEHNKGEKQQSPNRSRRVGKDTQKNYTKRSE